MAQFYLSAGVYTTERDLTIIPGSVPTADAGIAGVFRWGPVNQVVSVDSEAALVAIFGRPTNLNPETFFTAASFLSYARPLKVVRAANTTGNSTNITNTVTNAVAGPTNPSNTVIISSVVPNEDAAENKNWDPSVSFVARYPGALGNSIRVSVCESPAVFQSNVNLVPNSNIESAQTSITFTTGSSTATVLIAPSLTGVGADTLAVGNLVANNLVQGDLLRAGNNTIGTQLLKVNSVGAPTQVGANTTVVVNLASPYTLSVNAASTLIDRNWEFSQIIDKAPTTSDHQRTFGSNTNVVDQIHVVVVDDAGLFSGTPGTILETFETNSRNTLARNEAGRTIYYKNIINQESKYIWAASDLAGATSGNNTTITSSSAVRATRLPMTGGQDGPNEALVPLSVLTNGYDRFVNSEEVDVSIILQGMARDGTNGTGLANYLINNISERRKDCLVCISPESSDVVQAGNFAADRVVEFRRSLVSSSYAVMDSGYKYTHDKYNDVYRYVPLNGDIGGIIARSDFENDPWVSPAGLSRGVLKNVIKLAWNPSQTQRDLLYRNDVNPIVSLAGTGPVLYGDKTLLGKNSAFDKINVRKLFMIVEKSIAKSVTSLLWEFNNAQTQSLFINMVEPYLRDVQSRGGIYSFEVIADETVNTPAIVDSGGFVGNIIISPARSIDKIQLNFVATRTGVQFEEIINRF